MKKLAIFFVAVAALAFASCSLLQSTSTNTVAQAAGQSCGGAMVNLYRSYKSSGKVDLSNANNLANAVILATGYSQLRQNKDDQSYRKSFTNGLVLSGAGLITNANAGTIVNLLLNAQSLSGISQGSSAAQTQAAATTLTTLLQLL